MTTYKRKKDVGIYGMMAKWYDKNSRKSRIAEMQKYAVEITSHVDKGARVLEIAPGPGYLAIELAKKGYQVTGVELSPDFVTIEKNNAKEAKVSVDFKEGNAADLPSEANTYDFTICTAAFKNFADPVKALCEMHRVLKPGGMALIVDMNHDASKEDLKREVEKSGMRGFDKVFVEFSFKTFLKRSAYTKEDFEIMIKETPFNHFEIKHEGVSLFIYLTK